MRSAPCLQLLLIYLVATLRLSMCLINKELPLSFPVTVETSVLIENVGPVISSKMEFNLEYLLEQKWSVNQRVCEQFYLNPMVGTTAKIHKATKNLTHFTVSGEDLKGYWIPSTYVPEAKRMQLESSAVPNRHLTIFVKDTPGRECYFKYRIRLDASIGCKMQFKDYPNDIQVCKVRMRNSYASSHVRYVWAEDQGVLMVPEAGKLSNFQMQLNWTSAQVQENEDEYSWLVITLVFERRLSHFVIQVVAPSILLLLVAYCSCWIKLDSGPGRYLLTILTFLSLITMFNGSKRDLPKASYAMGADVWMIGCMLFIFATIVELTLVAYLDKKRQMNMSPSMALSKAGAEAGEPQKRRSSSAYRLPKGLSEQRNSPDYVGLRCLIKKTDAHDSNNNQGANKANGGHVKGGTRFSGQPLTAVSEVSEHDFGANPEPQMYSSVAVAAPSPPRHPPPPLPDTAYEVDIIFRIIYPFAFVVFNFLFWPLLLSRKLL